jgi:hypothetical protein
MPESQLSNFLVIDTTSQAYYTCADFPWLVVHAAASAYNHELRPDDGTHGRSH